MLLDANAAADASAPMEDSFALLALLLDDGTPGPGLGSMTLLTEEEGPSSAGCPFRDAAAAPATIFRRFFRGSNPRRQGLRYSMGDSPVNVGDPRIFGVGVRSILLVAYDSSMQGMY